MATIAERDPQPIRGDRGAAILGPRNVPLERENPDQLASPYTDSGTLPNLKFSFATARNRLLTGGWAREVTVRELPVATELAGVNMRLKPGGVREMHWHKEAEWAFMLAGRARITAVDEQGRTFIDDVGEGDLWNFPSVIPHSIQGLDEGCEFLLVFDNGSFSENETFAFSRLTMVSSERRQHPVLPERKDGTLMAWYYWLYAPRTGGAYDSHHRTAGNRRLTKAPSKRPGSAVLPIARRLDSERFRSTPRTCGRFRYILSLL
jgi:quercetin dioxygenase-like cupin family protein